MKSRIEVVVKMHNPIGQVRVQGRIARESDTSEMSEKVEIHQAKMKNATVSKEPTAVATKS